VIEVGLIVTLMISNALGASTLARDTVWLDASLVRGLGTTQIVLLALTAVVGALTILPGRATVQEGGVHLAIFGAFVFLAVNP